MNGELLQLITLVAHGNRFLVDPTATPPDPHSLTAFRYDRSVAFDGADDARSWLTAVRERGGARLSLDAEPVDPHLVAFANAGRWWIWTSDGEAWRGEWAVTDPDAPNHRIWTARFRRFEPGAAPVTRVPSAARAGLEQALAKASTFAANYTTGFKEWFDNGSKALHSSRPTFKRHDDLVPDGGYGLAARQVLAAAQAAWVFGGMGSWNDLVFDDDAVAQEYTEVSVRLFGALLDAIVVATNSFDGAVR